MEHSSQVEQAADLAVKKVFAILGVDVDSPKDVESFREDLRFGRKMRKLADQGAAGIIGLIAIGIGSALWLGITTLIKKG